jgi:archaemetzincin
MKYFYVGATADLRSEADRDALSAVRERVASEFQLPVRMLELDGLDLAYNAARKQYSSIMFLEMLAHLCPDDSEKALALTSRDLFIPVLTFVYGQAQLNGKLGVVSTARLHQEFYGLPPDRAILLRRAQTEAIHEAGHLFGLIHCPDRSCAMSLSTSVRQIDQKNAGFCHACSARVRPGRRERTL